MYNGKINRYENIKEGPQGRPGDPGPPGPTGYPGPRGYKGNNGYQGSTGPIGHTGPTGHMGPQGIQGENSGLTGPTGAQGPPGIKGEKGDNLIIYNDLSIYVLKLMSEFDRITTLTPLDVNIAILHLQYTSLSDKYIKEIRASKQGFNIIFNINTLSPIKYIHMSSVGDNLSIPISYTNIEYLSEYQANITFSFDSLLAFDEYIYPGAKYDIYINWF